jgi:oligopeptidase B
MPMPRVWPAVDAPQAQARPETRLLHGVEITDPYAWLRDANWREVLKHPEQLHPDIRAYLEAENAHAEALLAETKALQETLVGEMRSRIREDDAEPPFPDGPFAYYQRYVTGGEHRLICRRPREGGPETVVLNGDTEAEGHSFFSLKAAEHSPDHRLLAWSSDTTGSEYYTVHVRDLATGEDREHITDTTGHIVWLSGSNGFLYVRYDDNHRDNRVFLHRLGDDPANDTLLHEETTPGCFISLDRTQDGAFVTITIADHETGEVRIVSSDDPAAAPRLIAPRQNGVLYEVDHHDGQFIILTNADGARDYKIVTAPVAAPGRANWVDLVPHQPGRLIMSHTCYAHHLVWQERNNAVPALVIRNWADGAPHAIAFDEPTYALSHASGLEYATDTLRFTYSSLSTPPETYAYDMGSRERTLDGTAPCLLYGYGAYGIVDERRLPVKYPVAGRSRLRLRHRPCARRHGQGLSLVSGRQARAQDQHLHRFHRRRRGADRARATPRAGGSSPRAARPAGC